VQEILSFPTAFIAAMLPT